MRIAHTFWTRPERAKLGTDDPKKLALERFGHKSADAHLICWALSAHQMIKHYPDSNVLVTDSIGKAILIDMLGLPYKEVSLALDDCPFYGQEFWMHGKIFSYGTHKEPFINIDNDVLLWRPLPATAWTVPLVAQSLETFDFFTCYQQCVERFAKVGLKDIYDPVCRHAYNCGVFGGSDLETIAIYVKQSLAYLEKHTDQLRTVAGMDKDRFLWGNIMLEQYWFAKVAAQRGVKVASIVIEKWWTLSDNDKKNLCMTHLLGSAKQRDEVVAKVKKRAIAEIPGIEERVREMVAA